MSLAREAAATAHRVDSHVYIGGYLAAADADYVRREGFARILKLFADTPEYPGGRHRHPGVTYKVVEAEDRADYPLDVHFADCLEFIQDGIRRGEKTLVHCHAGVSRSGTIVLLHLMVNRGTSTGRSPSCVGAARSSTRIRGSGLCCAASRPGRSPSGPGGRSRQPPTRLEPRKAFTLSSRCIGRNRS